MPDTANAKKKPAGARTATRQPIAILTYKGSREFYDWIKDLAVHVRLPLTITLDMALMEYAERHGFAPMPCRQIRRSA